MTLEQHFVEHRQRRIRGAIGEAERQGDLAGVTALMTERMELDRRLRELHRRLEELVSQDLAVPMAVLRAMSAGAMSYAEAADSAVREIRRGKSLRRIW